VRTRRACVELGRMADAKGKSRASPSKLSSAKQLIAFSTGSIDTQGSGRWVDLSLLSASRVPMHYSSRDVW